MVIVQVYKQKLRHVLSEQQNAIIELKMDAVAATSLVNRKHAQSELTLHGNIEGLQAELTEKKFLIESRIKELQRVRHSMQMYH